jgi:transcriptional regulator with XRE-family HTH domain
MPRNRKVVDDIYELTGRCVRQAREKAGLTQAELASQSGIHPGFVGCIERGEKKPSLETVDRFCRALGLTFGALYSTARGEVRNGAAEFRDKRIQVLAGRLKPGDRALVARLLAIMAEGRRKR